MAIFDKIIGKTLNLDFLTLCDNGIYAPAKKIIEEIFLDFIDKDGNFIEQFQTTGFYQRIWELLLFKSFISEGFSIDSTYNRPDFYLKKNNLKIFVEATTSNLAEKDSTSEDLIKIVKSNNPLVERKIASEKLKKYYIEKIGSALSSKLNKKYYELSYLKGKPLIIAISPMHDEYARQNSDYLLISYLYGYEFKAITDVSGNLINLNYIQKELFEKKNGALIDFFFSSPHSEFISGVLFYNDNSIDKFNRMGFVNKFDKNLIGIRNCNIYEPTSKEPKDYTYFLNKPSHIEDWKEGISLFHNPKAINPINKELFSGFRQVWFVNGKLDGYIPEFFPYNSLTVFDYLDDSKAV